MTRPSVLLLRALGLGDFLTGVPAYRAVRAAFPGHEIVLAAPPVLTPLARLTGAVDVVVPTVELGPVALPRPPELAVDLHGDGPASHRVVEGVGAGRVLEFASAAAPDVAGPWWDDGEHEVTRWCRLLAWGGIAADPAALRIDPPRDPGASHVLVHPGAAYGSRRWPPDRFARVARALRDRGHRVLVSGGGGERALAAEVAERAGLPYTSVLAGRTGLMELAGYVAAAELVVCGDTGVSHLATACGTPSVTLFGPVSPALWGPPAGSARHLVLWKGGDAGRPGDAHGDAPDPRLLAVTPDEVLDRCDRLVSADVPARG
ncbi:glycosyltransferase family 9 protein [Actinomadura flavalba]|uniref:glycosyltransferase family 9 protein n=1 Tax=Actinomadura flavalba TaxID=1120938 RepID=UPI0003777C94|nr:glycosyltransferase family 9 protein [Actinomadura flavalba]